VCNRCFGSGTIVATHKENHGLYCFRCPCGIAERRKLAQIIPAWADRLAHYYDVPFQIVKQPDYKQMKANPRDYSDEPF
jgi:hypothetical protein